MKIEAAVLRDGVSFSIEELALEEPRPGEILVRLVATGVCHTDVKMADIAGRVPRPIVLGHEGAGVVERVGDGVHAVEPGDHVVMSFDYCGECPCCRNNRPAYCYSAHQLNFAGERSDGSTSLSRGNERIHSAFFGQSAFATYALCNERNVVKVDKTLPLELLGPLGCGVQTGAGTVFNVFKLERGSSFAVFGVGTVGLSAVMAARVAAAARIIAIDVAENRLAMARELGATDVIDAKREDAQAKILALTGVGVDAALDTTGSSEVIRQAIQSLGPLGTCGILATSADPDPSFSVLHLMSGGRRLQGIIEGDAVPQLFIPKLLDLYGRGQFPFDRLVRFYPFAQIGDAIAASRAGAAIKPVLRFA
jgi:aryl-alcohol dehydrogenase